MRRLGERTRDQHREAGPLDNKTGRCSVVPKEYRKRERENEENRIKRNAVASTGVEGGRNLAGLCLKWHNGLG